MASERTSHLTKLDLTDLGGRRKRENREREDFSEMSSTLSLDFSMIGPSNPG